MKKYLIIITIFIISSSSILFGHNYEFMAGITAGNDIYFNEKGIGMAPEINLTFCIFNMGTNIQFQNKLDPSYNFFIGLGLLNLLQLQYGINSSDNRLRIKTIIPIMNGYLPIFNRDGEWYNRINLQLQYEDNFNKSELSNFSIGISYLIL